MSQLHVIVQAGGRGSRLRHHTWNKPKCLVSVLGKPILYHLFDKFPDASFVIIGDYLYEQLEKYLLMNPPSVTYSLIRTVEKGTAAGIAAALKTVPEEAPLLLTWSDLFIHRLPRWPSIHKPVICTTSSFTCRWTVSPTGELTENPGNQNGISGIFYFPRAYLLPCPPAAGEFVKWFSTTITDYELMDFSELEELGEFTAIEESNNRAGFCRFFNKVDIGETQVTKTVLDVHYQNIHKNEVAWYREAQKLGFRRVPKIISENPLILQKINGLHAYQMDDLTERERRALIADYLDSLISLHDLDKAPADQADVTDVYLSKTISRVQSISKIIPGFERPFMTINGKKCRNVFARKHEGVLEQLILKLHPDQFVPIHGDATFSNTIIDDKLKTWFIDPRGYFAREGIMGDAWYDFAKVYYSAIGGYDSFNRRRFKLHIDNETIEVLMEKPLFTNSAQIIFNDYFGDNINRIKTIHGLIWLALSGYVKDDIDSIIGSFYLGLYWLEEGMSS